MKDKIEIDIQYDVARAIAKRAIKHPESYSLMKEYEDKVAATGHFDLNEFNGVLGNAITNDFVVDSLIEMLKREHTQVVLEALRKELNVLNGRMAFINSGDDVLSETDPNLIATTKAKTEFAMKAINIAVREIESRGIPHE